MTAKEMLGKVDHTQLKAFARSCVMRRSNIIPPVYVYLPAILREFMTPTETKSISAP